MGLGLLTRSSPPHLTKCSAVPVGRQVRLLLAIQFPSRIKSFFQKQCSSFETFVTMCNGNFVEIAACYTYNAVRHVQTKLKGNQVFSFFFNLTLISFTRDCQRPFTCVEIVTCFRDKCPARNVVSAAKSRKRTSHWTIKKKAQTHKEIIAYGCE